VTVTGWSLVGSLLVMTASVSSIAGMPRASTAHIAKTSAPPG
jgi:hypothetical protein